MSADGAEQDVYDVPLGALEGVSFEMTVLLDVSPRARPKKRDMNGRTGRKIL